MNKSALWFFVILFLVNSGQAAAATNFPVFLTKSQSVVFKFPYGWYKNPDDHPYDLQCFSADKSEVTGVFEFLAETLSEGFQAQDIFAFQIADIESKRENFKLYADEQVFDTKNKRVTTRVYSGEKSHLRHLYVFSLLEFKKSGTVVVVLQITFPSEWQRNRATLHKIVMNARSKSL